MVGQLPLWAVVAAAYALCANAQDDPAASTTSSVYPVYGTGSASFLDNTNGITSILIQGKARTYTQTQSAGGIEVRYPLPTPTSLKMEARGHKKHHHHHHHHVTHHHKKATHRKKTHHKASAKKHTSKKHSSSSKGSSGVGSAGEAALTYDLVDIQCGIATDGLPSDCTMYGVQQAATSTVVTMAGYVVPGGLDATNFVNVLVPAPTAGIDAAPSSADAAPGSSVSPGTPSQTAASAGQTKQVFSNPLSPSSSSALSQGIGAHQVASAICLTVAVVSAALFI